MENCVSVSGGIRFACWSAGYCSATFASGMCRTGVAGELGYPAFYARFCLVLKFHFFASRRVQFLPTVSQWEDRLSYAICSTSVPLLCTFSCCSVVGEEK
jgi:hypothetical protein